MGFDGIGIGRVGRRRAAAGVGLATSVSVESTQRPTGCKTSRLLRVWGFVRLKSAYATRLLIKLLPYLANFFNDPSAGISGRLLTLRLPVPSPYIVERPREVS